MGLRRVWGGSHILLKISFRDQAPLQGKGGKEGLIILTVVRNLYKPTPGPHGCGSQQRSLLCVPPSSTCSTGVEDEAAPWWCLPVLCLWGVALTTTPHFLKNHSSQLSVLFQKPRTAAPHTWLHNSVTSVQLHLGFLRCASKPRWPGLSILLADGQEGVRAFTELWAVVQGAQSSVGTKNFF